MDEFSPPSCIVYVMVAPLTFTFYDNHLYLDTVSIYPVRDFIFPATYARDHVCQKYSSESVGRQRRPRRFQVRHQNHVHCPMRLGLLHMVKVLVRMCVK